MSEDSEQITFLRRILVGLDTSSHSQAALEAAAALAQILEARVHGLFVQDETWKKISRIPSSSAIHEITGTIQSFEEKRIDEQVEILKKRLRRRIKTISRKKKIKHSWQTVQGNVEEKILEAAEKADIITLGHRGSTFPRKKRLGSSTKAVIQRSGKPVLILKKGVHLGTHITALYDASEASQKGLRFALMLAEREGNPLHILVVDNNPEVLEERNREIEKQLENATVKTNIHLIRQTGIWRFMHGVNSINSGLLVMPKEQPIIQNRLEPLLAQLRCPLLIVS